MGCCHPARRFEIKNVVYECIKLTKGTTNGMYNDLLKREMQTTVIGHCGVCGTSLTIKSPIDVLVSGDWSKAI